MTDNDINGVGLVPDSKWERAQLVAKALGEAARRARLSKKNSQFLATSRAARAEKMLDRISAIMCIVVFVIPSLLVAVYYLFVASDQYAAEARFTVRGSLPPRLDTIGALTGMPSALVMQDTFVLSSFVYSRDMIERLEKTIPLRKIYSDPAADVLSRVHSDATIEKFLKYWKSMVDLSITMPSGIVTLSVRSFAPEDSARIAKVILDAFGALINDMNERMIHDMLAVSELEREQAEANLVKARARLESTRNTEGMLSADEAGKALNGFILTLRTELAKLQQDYETQRRYVREDAPQMRNLSVRIEAANDEIKQLQAQLTAAADGKGVRPASGAMTQLDYMNLDNTIAERIYASSLVLLEHARLASESRLLHLHVFVPPAVAQTARYPHRWSRLGVFAFIALIVWLVLVLLMRLTYKYVPLRSIMHSMAAS